MSQYRCERCGLAAFHLNALGECRTCALTCPACGSPRDDDHPSGLCRADRIHDKE